MDGDGGYGVSELAMVMGISRRVLHGSQATEHEDVGVDVGHGQEEGSSTDHNSSRDLRIAAMFIIMSASTLGFLIPVILTKWKRIQFSLESRVLLVGKAFSAGVVVATALVHMFPEALSSFESDRLAEHPWQKFPWVGAMTTLAALVTHVFDCMATTHIQRKHGMKLEEVTSSTALTASGAGAMLDVTAMGKTPGAEGKGDVVVDCHEHQHQNCEKLTRNIVVAEILEYGIASHSVLIGITLGVLTDRSEIQPLLIALVFHKVLRSVPAGFTRIYGGKHKLVCDFVTLGADLDRVPASSRLVTLELPGYGKSGLQEYFVDQANKQYNFQVKGRMKDDPFH
ncbi:hypothetical protein CBR_g42085 [Chara braunii]|uniref:Uncharacterized protein n=1 Tax=Chara braunii TaxID=69332 RepID=A0A388LX52_CHABU|nr:hypothetical protein CBR_g42085 [Chara braunii]|eukprot:GBG86802.1 hypothetical protein CBR_g42085 [Chara braunii]